MMKKRLSMIVLVSTLLLTGCMSLAPDYERPSMPVAAQWRNQAAAREAEKGAAQPLTSISWQSFFRDERLRQVITLALEHNRDLRVSVLNIEKARAQYRVRRSESLPSVSASASQTTSRSAASTSMTGEAGVGRQYSAEIGFSSYELDIFGRVRSLNDQALETFFATEETRRSTQLSLIAEVAGDWLSLATNRQLLKLASDTLASQQRTLALSEARHKEGAISGLDLAQVRMTVESARSDVAQQRAQIEQDRNALELVVGTSVPDNLLPDATAANAVALAQIPASLNSTVLLDRPDVVSAEHSLKAANAEIGAARAAFFPIISLTVSGGQSSDQLSNLFSGANRTWSFIPSVSIPIFTAGNLNASLKSSEAERDIAVADYEKTIQTAFREVADALAIRSTMQEQIDAQKALVAAGSSAYRLADARYRSGMDGYLDALDAQRTLYSAQKNQLSLLLSDLTNRVTLYKVLGGGVVMDQIK